MQYLLLFLEGILAFISPCLLPLIPIYIAFLTRESGTVRSILRAIGFVIGFTTVFVAMGAFAGSFGSLLKQHQNIVNILSGGIVVVFGLHYIGLLKINLLNRTVSYLEPRGPRKSSICGVQPRGPRKSSICGVQPSPMVGLLGAIVFGMTFAVGWTPCVGAFLGSALMMAAQQGSTLSGILMLSCFSAGLAVPFLISALLIEQIKLIFNKIKGKYRIINILSGGFLVMIGLLMMAGLMGKFLRLFV